MISVCIPVYNSYINELIKALYYQKVNTKYQVEIVVIDDASGDKYKQENRKLAKYIDNYIELSENIGRAKIRNLFIQYTAYPNLLFIDCDSGIGNSDFLKKYLETVKANSGKVIVGGSIYSGIKPEKNKLLRWKYGHKIESKPASIRNKNPYRSFKTNNVIIPGRVLRRLPFNESLRGYGHEDTLMGFALKKAGKEILHIDNSVINTELDTNEEFLNKSKEAVKSLFQALELTGGDKAFIEDVKLLSKVRELYEMKLASTVRGVLNIVDPFIGFYLKNGLPSLFLFNLFKLHHALKVCSETGAEKYFRD